MKNLLTQLFYSSLTTPFRTANASKLINSVLWSYINEKNKSNNSNGFYKLNFPLSRVFSLGFFLYINIFISVYGHRNLQKDILLHLRKFSQNTMRVRSLSGFSKIFLNCCLNILPQILLYYYLCKYKWNSVSLKVFKS